MRVTTQTKKKKKEKIEEVCGEIQGHGVVTQNLKMLLPRRPWRLTTPYRANLQVSFSNDEATNYLSTSKD
jgi:hypothetical protein